MSYSAISVKEAVKSINNTDTNGWFLPAIQRPYVWGSRYENELYICKLFDSLLRGYPIGGLIIWNTKEKVPFREFIRDYRSGFESDRPVEEGLWERPDKWLVYDGQQRLQTLYSCLRYTFNNKILIFDLLYKRTDELGPDETGFEFVELATKLQWHQLKMNELFTHLPDEEYKPFERKQIKAMQLLKGETLITEDEEDLLCKNLDQLWKILVQEDKKSLSYYPISTSKETEVNEIFERLNSGGMALTQADLLFSNIKASYPDFEWRLETTSKLIYNNTNSGYLFNAYNILQLLNLIIKSNIRVDAKKVKKSELKTFDDKWKKLEKPIFSFFVDYLWGQFKINNNSIIPRKNALLPLMVYFFELYDKGYKFKDITKSNLQKINQYLIKSQINDWNLNTFVDKFSNLIHQSAKNSTGLFEFPLKQIEDEVISRGNRPSEISENNFKYYIWFSLKILTPQKVYQFDPDIVGRFNPEIDHIFPRKLKGRSKEYEQDVDVIWNMMPTKGDINAYKTNNHPREFFTDKVKDKSGKIISGSKYLDDYEFLSPLDEHKQIDFAADVWSDHKKFIAERRKRMIDFLKTKYGIELV